MKNARPYPCATITPKGERALTSGHPWVYDAEVTELVPAPGETEIKNGSIVDVVSRKGSYLGSGTISQSSKIRIRLITRNANDRFDDAFWMRKVRWAWDHRKATMGEDTSSCRVIFSEGDDFGGLIVDKFEDVLVAQVLSIGMEEHKQQIFDALLTVFAENGIAIRGIYERNDVSSRKLEGLPETTGWARYDQNAETPKSDTSVIINENGVRYCVDFENGQKTGFFLDQKYNRQAVARLARGKTVLDCFTHTGSFALNAARGGAKHVTAVDVSDFAVACARENAARNGLESVVDCVAANVFDLLPRLQKGQYDFIILDPPAFTKSRQTTRRAMAGYKEINYRAMRLLPRGGYLATCSCSHFATEELFRKMLRDAAHDAGVQLRQIEARQQAADHPILWGVEETSYLKFYLFQVV